jgi:hypothetical protein
VQVLSDDVGAIRFLEWKPGSVKVREIGWAREAGLG